MAFYDKAKVHRAKKAREYLATLEGPDADNLKKWISDREDYIEKISEKNKAMSEVFEGIGRFTNKRQLIMGS